MSDGTTLRTALDLLDRWRHYPNYQLERRADIFFAAFLPGFIDHMEGDKEVGRSIKSTIVPELPLKRDLVVQHEGKESERSVKVDYVAFQSDLARAFLVELKTDMTSLRDGQYRYLASAASHGLRKIIEGLREIATASVATTKYLHLFAALAEAGVVSLPESLRDHVPSRDGRGTAGFGAIRIREGVGDTVAVRILQPKGKDIPTELREVEDVRVWDFSEFGEYLGGVSGELAELFRPFVERWSSAPARSLPKW